MKITIFILAVVFGAVLGRPEAQIAGRHIPTLTQTAVQDEAGQYAFSFSTGNGISAAEHGALKPNAARTDNVLAKQGSFAFVAPDGQIYKTTYTADENGFQAFGDHLPKDI